MIIFWNITPCSPLKVNRRFGGTCHVHIQVRRISQAALLATSFHAGFLLCLFSDPEDGRDVPVKRLLTSNGLHGVIS
jgi:hypothetical protein